MDNKIAALILAGGKGTRTRLTSINKVALPFQGKAMIVHAVNLMSEVASPTVVVVGKHAETVIKVLEGRPVTFAYQNEQLGTAHAALCGLTALEGIPVSHVLIGYGDHLMHYRKDTVLSLINMHVAKNEALTLVVSESDNVNELKYGRIIRSNDGTIQKIIEQKDADEKTLAIKEFNAGFYCVSYDFLKNGLPLIKPSPVTGEYYITDLIEIAIAQHKKVLPYHVPFEEVGWGVNTLQDLEISSKISRYGV